MKLLGILTRRTDPGASLEGGAMRPQGPRRGLAQRLGLSATSRGPSTDAPRATWPLTHPTVSDALDRVDTQPASGRFAPEAWQRFIDQRIQERRDEVDRLRAPGQAPLPAEQQPLAAYLAARSIDSRAVDVADVERLRRGHAAVVETRRALRHGRGNVESDIASTNRESLYRTDAGREILDELAEGAPPTTAQTAAAALLLEAGNCGEFARVAAHEVANGRLADDERLHVVGPVDADHHFAEIRSRAGHEHDVVVDGWARGPAVLAPDGEFSASREMLGLDFWTADKAEADRLVADVRKHRATLEERLRPLAEEIVELQRSRGRSLVEPEVWAETPLVSVAFAKRVAKKMDKPIDPRAGGPRSWLQKAKRRLLGVASTADPMRRTRNQLHAVAALRMLDSDVRNATAQADAVVSKARDLRG